MVLHMVVRNGKDPKPEHWFCTACSFTGRKVSKMLPTLCFFFFLLKSLLEDWNRKLIYKKKKRKEQKKSMKLANGVTHSPADFLPQFRKLVRPY